MHEHIRPSADLLHLKRFSAEVQIYQFSVPHQSEARRDPDFHSLPQELRSTESVKIIYVEIFHCRLCLPLLRRMTLFWERRYLNKLYLLTLQLLSVTFRQKSAESVQTEYRQAQFRFRLRTQSPAASTGLNSGLRVQFKSPRVSVLLQACCAIWRKSSSLKRRDVSQAGLHPHSIFTVFLQFYFLYFLYILCYIVLCVA